MTSRYLAELLPLFTDHEKHVQPWTYLLDSAGSNGRFADLLSEEMFPWHVQTSMLNEGFRGRVGRSAIRRVNPIVGRDYSEDVLRLLKYNLHFQLALGLDVHVLLVDSPGAAETYCGVDNLAIVARRKLITDRHPYDPDVPSELRVQPWTDSGARDLYGAIEEIGRAFPLFRLHYDNSAFTCSQRDVKRKYGDVLYAIQNGRCALTGEPLEGDWHVDHIFPREKGGNNTLVNLQAVNARPNILKGATITAPAHCLSVPELAAAGLGTSYHHRLTDRTLTGVAVGLKAPFDVRAWLN